MSEVPTPPSSPSGAASTPLSKLDPGTSAAAMAAMTDGIWLLDAQGRVIHSNGRLERTLGVDEPPDVERCGLRESFHGDYPRGCLFHEMVRSGKVTEGEFRHEPSGRWLRITCYPIHGDGGELLGATHVARDISDTVQIEAMHDLLEATVDQSPDVVLISSVDLRIVYVNSAFERLVGRGRDEMLGRRAWDMLEIFSGDNGMNQVNSVLRNREPFHGLLTVTRADGRQVHLGGSVLPLKDSTGTLSHLVCIGRDLTQQEELERRVQHLAYFDALTDLPNRTLFMDRLTPAMARAEHSSRVCALVVLNLDNFKAINHALGTAAGDDVLRAIAASLLASVRDGDTVARLGGDDFGLALLDMKWPEDVSGVLDKIQQALNKPIALAGTDLEITASMGIALCPSDGTLPSDVLEKATLAMADAKREGPGTIRYYSAEMGSRLEKFMATSARLRKALERGEFRAYYQPYYDITTGDLAGMEALIRWQTEDRGLVPPHEFISVLEETGMVVPAGLWMIDTVCRQVVEWQRQGRPVAPVAVNLSPVQFRTAHLLDDIRRIITDTDVDPRLLTFEVTESTFIEDPEYTRSILTALRALGARISIDDFGTGYSSLAYLKRFPVDHLKIDQSFVRDIIEDVDDATLVSTIITMAHNLGIRTIAEGVETAEHLRILRILRCDIAQGYFFTPPVPPDREDKLFGPR